MMCPPCFISDIDLARIWMRAWKPEPGTYEAPAAVVIWDGLTARTQPTGAALDPAAALLAPRLAAKLAKVSGMVTPAEPTIAALEADYSAATAPWRAVPGLVVAPELFQACLRACRACNLFRESARAGRGQCDSVRRGCSRVLHWHGAARCPESKWPA